MGKLLAELNEIKKTKGTYILVSSPADYNSTCASAVSYFTSKFKGLYVSLSKPSGIISSDFSKKRVNVGNLYFIDSAGKGVEKDKNCIHISNNQSLTELSLAITSLVKENDFGFFIFDSVSTLLMYNELDSVERFMHFIITKIRNIGTATIILAVDEEKSNKLVSVIAQFCDKVVKV